MVGKTSLYIFRIGCTPIPLFVSSIYQGTILIFIYLEPQNLRLYQLTKNIAAEILPHTSSALRDLGVILEKCLLSSCPRLVDEDPEGLYGNYPVINLY